MTAIYEGKFLDRLPAIRAAGIFTASGQNIEDCVKKLYQPPPTPDKILRFDRTFCPEPGAQTIHYGKASDPDYDVAKGIRHGVPSKSTGNTAKSLLNPPLLTNFEQRMFDQKESTYHRERLKPLGKQRPVCAPFPAKCDPLLSPKFSFGLASVKSESAGSVVNPARTWPMIEEEEEKGHQLYVRSHLEYWPQEQLHRPYNTVSEGGGYDVNRAYGYPTPMDQRGTAVARALHWIGDERDKKATPIGSKRVEDFKERTQMQLGQPLDPNRVCREGTVGADHAYGIRFPPDLCTVSDLLHSRAPAHCIRALPDGNNREPSERERALATNARMRLKNESFQKFGELLDTLSAKDKENSGTVSVADLREAFRLLAVPLEIEQTEQLAEFFDSQHGSRVPYRTLIDNLNWMTFTPTKFRSSATDVGNFDPARPPTPQRLQPLVEGAIASQCLQRGFTNNALVNATVGGPIPTPGYRKLGIPTIRSDIVGPRIRRTADRQCYGDEGNAGGLLNPNLFSNHQVFEKDFILPRGKNEMRHLLEQSGASLSPEQFEILWPRAVQNYRAWCDVRPATTSKESVVASDRAAAAAGLEGDGAVSSLQAFREEMQNAASQVASVTAEEKTRAELHGAIEALEVLGIGRVC